MDVDDREEAFEESHGDSLQKEEEMDFKILENVIEKKKEKINLSLPKWCQDPVMIHPRLENLEKIKKIKPLIRPEIYKNLKEMGFKTLFPVQSTLTMKLLQRGPRRDFAVQGKLVILEESYRRLKMVFSTDGIGKNISISNTIG